MTTFIPGHKPQTSSEQRCYIVIAGGELLCRDGGFWEPLSAPLWQEHNPQPDALQFCIGLYNNLDCFAVVLEGCPAIPGYHWVNLRRLMPLLDETHYQLGARALQLHHWQRDHQFCGRCGSATSLHGDELATHCAHCDLLFYPRLSPCVMVLIARGEHCLLARNARFPAGLFSVLAGFIEVGETVEAALRREVQEEVGLAVDHPSYFGSQAWPFPSQLMLGFRARYASGNIRADEIEIEEAAWFHYRHLPQIPNQETLSGQLIAAFVNDCAALNNDK